MWLLPLGWSQVARLLMGRLLDGQWWAAQAAVAPWMGVGYMRPPLLGSGQVTHAAAAPWAGASHLRLLLLGQGGNNSYKIILLERNETP